MRKLNLIIDNENKLFFIENNSQGIELREIANEVEDNYGGYIALASINNKLYELTTKIDNDCIIKFLDNLFGITNPNIPNITINITM